MNKYQHALDVVRALESSGSVPGILNDAVPWYRDRAFSWESGCSCLGRDPWAPRFFEVCGVLRKFDAVTTFGLDRRPCWPFLARRDMWFDRWSCRYAALAAHGWLDQRDCLRRVDLEDCRMAERYDVRALLEEERGAVLDTEDELLGREWSESGNNIWVGIAFLPLETGSVELSLLANWTGRRDERLKSVRVQPGGGPVPEGCARVMREALRLAGRFGLGGQETASTRDPGVEFGLARACA